MPLRRTPPSTPNMFYSDPNLSTSETENLSPKFVSHRSKRRREEEENPEYDNFKKELLNMFKDLKAGQKLHSTTLQAVKEELLEQNNKMRESVEFLSAKYDEMLEKFKKIEDARTNDRKYIQNLEGKVEHLERKLRCTSVEIRNIPTTGKESKDTLMDMVIKTGNLVNVDIKPQDFKDIFRTNHKNGKTAIIADLNSTLLKEKLLKSINVFNGSKPRESKLNTTHLNINGPKTPIYISENLSAKTRKLFILSKEFALRNNYKYCWISYGQIYLRKNDGDARTKIESEADLANPKT